MNANRPLTNRRMGYLVIKFEQVQEAPWMVRFKLNKFEHVHSGPCMVRSPCRQEGAGGGGGGTHENRQTDKLI